jgi:hypothetical protein
LKAFRVVSGCCETAEVPFSWQGWTLVEVVTLIAADASDQQGWLHENQLAADELRQQLADVMDSRLWSCCLSDDHEIVGAIRRLNDHIWSFSEHENGDRRTESVLFDDPGWAEGRRLAREFLPALVLVVLENAPRGT